MQEVRYVDATDRLTRAGDFAELFGGESVEQLYGASSPHLGEVESPFPADVLVPITERERIRRLGGGTRV